MNVPVVRCKTLGKSKCLEGERGLVLPITTEQLQGGDDGQGSPWCGKEVGEEAGIGPHPCGWMVHQLRRSGVILQ